MELRIEREPCMLYETVELLYAFVNDIPAERLTAEGTYCIPEGSLLGLWGLYVQIWTPKIRICTGTLPGDPF